MAIPSATVAKAGERIAEHARQHALAEVRVILHGGEPLLAGATRLGEIAGQLNRAITPVCPLDLRIHTNGVQLDEALCEVFLAAGVKVGISLDGDRAGNDRHRRYRDGRSSYDQVIHAVDLLRTERYSRLYAGLLCTIDVANDPVATYDALAALEPPAIDFLLPHATWDTPPPAAGPGTPYADWLIAVFDRWRADGGRVPVRMFESIARTSRGASSLTESLGLEASDVAVIETDGAIEQADSIKVAYDGAPATGFDIFSNALSEAAGHPAIQARQLGIDGLSDTCRQCPVVASCGGGLYAHRYRTENGFDNPSVYCADLEKIIKHVQARLFPAPSAAGAAAEAQAPRRQPSSAPQLLESDFDALAAGLGDGATVAELVRLQRRDRIQLLRLLRVRAVAADEMFLAGWALLARLGKEHPAAFDQVLAHPYVRAWAEHCLRAGANTASLPADADVARWQERFASAWRLIESAYPTYAAGLAAGLSTIMPLSGGPAGKNISAAAREAFGAVGVALPDDGETLAELLIHEFQHVKLGALLDLYELCDPGAAGRLFYAPWREDPRPIEATLQGTYAHLGVTDYWRARRHRAQGQAAVAAAERFARWRALTAEAIETLAGSGALTKRGDRVIAGMRGTIEPWLREPVDAAAAEAARTWATQNRSAWERRRQS
jgi:uncharacterized protein